MSSAEGILFAEVMSDFGNHVKGLGATRQRVKGSTQNELKVQAPQELRSWFLHSRW